MQSNLNEINLKTTNLKLESEIIAFYNAENFKYQIIKDSDNKFVGYDLYVS